MGQWHNHGGELKMKKILCTFLMLFLFTTEAYAQTAIWASTDREGTTTEMRIPVDISAVGSAGYFSITPDIATGIFFNSAGNFVNDAGFVYDSTDNDLSVLNNMEAASFCDAAGSNCVATTAMVTASGTDTFTNKNFDANGTGNSLSNVDTADATSTTGSDTTFATGTAGTNGNVAIWNADGDLVDGVTVDANILVDGDIGGSVQAFDADTAKTDVAQEYTAQQNFNATTLTALGADLVTNGDFASDTNWTKGTGWAIGSGVATTTGGGGDSDLTEDTLVLISGKTYQVTFTITAQSGGVVTPKLGTQEGTDRSTVDTFTENIVSNGTTLNLQSDNSGDLSIDNVIVKLANVSWDLSTNQVTSLTLDGDLVLDNPTNKVDGATYIINLIQDGTGTRLLTYGSEYKFPGGTAPTLTTASGSVDILTCVSDGSNMNCVFQGDFK